MPSFSTALRSSTSTSRSSALPIFLRLLAEPGRRDWLPGRLPNSRARVDAPAIAAPRSGRAASRLAAASSRTTSATLPQAGAARLAWCRCRGSWHRPSADRRRHRHALRWPARPSDGDACGGRAAQTRPHAASAALKAFGARRRRATASGDAPGGDPGRGGRHVEQLARLGVQVAGLRGVGDQRRESARHGGVDRGRHERR